MNVFRGWYRKPFSRKGAVWHRIYYIDSILKDNRITRTVCGRQLPTKCDFDTKPDQTCMQCSFSPGVIVEARRGFVPMCDANYKITRMGVIKELRRLLKDRTYNIRIFEHDGVTITASWQSDTSIDLSCHSNIFYNKKRGLLTMKEVQWDLTKFKSDIECLCDASDRLAKQAKCDKGEYFEGLLAIVEK